MKPTPTLLLISVLTLNSLSAQTCKTAYQGATYGLQHVKTALEANNAKQLKQYARRSLEAMNEVVISTKNCGCVDANYNSFDAVARLEKALEQEAIDKIRFYVSKAKSNIKETFLSLDSCATFDSSDALASAEDDLLSQERALNEQREALMAQQKKLQEQMENQKRMQAEITLQKEALFTSQLELKNATEASLLELQQSVSNLLHAFGKNSSTVTNTVVTRSSSALKQETLNQTKAFYQEAAEQLAQQLLNGLEE